MAKKFGRNAADQFSQHISSQTGDAKITISTEELKYTIKNPPKKPKFPTELTIVVSFFEIADILELATSWSGIARVIYGSLRMCVSISLYFWAYQRLQGVKIIGVRRLLLKKAGRRALIALATNLPIPYIGSIVGLIPMDAVFVIMTHNDHSKFVQLIWKGLEKISVRVDTGSKVTRKARSSSGSPSPTEVTSKTKSRSGTGNKK